MFVISWYSKHKQVSRYNGAERLTEHETRQDQKSNRGAIFCTNIYIDDVFIVKGKQVRETQLAS